MFSKTLVIEQATVGDECCGNNLLEAREAVVCYSVLARLRESGWEPTWYGGIGIFIPRASLCLSQAQRR
jgi:hypothetical protein